MLAAEHEHGARLLSAHAGIGVHEVPAARIPGARLEPGATASGVEQHVSFARLAVLFEYGVKTLAVAMRAGSSFSV